MILILIWKRGVIVMKLVRTVIHFSWHHVDCKDTVDCIKRRTNNIFKYGSRKRSKWGEETSEIRDTTFVCFPGWERVNTSSYPLLKYPNKTWWRPRLKSLFRIPRLRERVRHEGESVRGHRVHGRAGGLQLEWEGKGDYAMVLVMIVMVMMMMMMMTREWSSACSSTATCWPSCRAGGWPR